MTRTDFRAGKSLEEQNNFPIDASGVICNVSYVMITTRTVLERFQMFAPHRQYCECVGYFCKLTRRLDENSTTLYKARHLKSKNKFIKFCKFCLLKFKTAVALKDIVWDKNVI